MVQVKFARRHMPAGLFFMLAGSSWPGHMPMFQQILLTREAVMV
ncbi:hypothetical protein AB434_2508 [Heyndrickxia coagulans]|uniref:Uncharacterized protein n=1 Tax=Heyndrickxia coagulans TaxID=1398 RepID=A0A0C5C5J1_HEYCO|nr:hypothetical protein SB48_HM08orf04454 [Heyndrickxia coagulans]AKN54913.1 hypothetical protein AB434_2508 [Heyndrickxia coagulans]KWZ77241.1 hypothetical protein HMPREF3213_03430 [Heyndrickxia coagulans]KYC90484.1 hypothetical protein B4096_0148 [Heyndrickxia coagulans]